LTKKGSENLPFRCNGYQVIGGALLERDTGF